MNTFPKLDTPTYSITLPISKIVLTYRPYLTKEEKLLLMALETKDSKAILNAIRQVAINCLITPNNLNIDNLPMVDLEYLFLHLRAKSKGEVLEAQFSCKAEIKNGESIDNEEIPVTCNNPLLLATRIDELKVSNMENFQDTIPLTDKVGVKMRLTRYKDMAEATLNEAMTPTQKAYALVRASIESVYDENEVFKVDKSNLPDLENFLDSLTTEQFRKIEAWFENIPKIDYTFNVKCNKCGFDHAIHYKDTASFF